MTWTVLKKLDADGVHAVWQKALRHSHQYPEGAITAARPSLKQSVLTHSRQDGHALQRQRRPPVLYRGTAKQLNLARSQHTEEIFKQILRGRDRRNRRSRGSPQSDQRRSRPRTETRASLARHAQLAVDLAGALRTTCLDETWLAKETNELRGLLRLDVPDFNVRRRLTQPWCSTMPCICRADSVTILASHTLSGGLMKGLSGACEFRTTTTSQPVFKHHGCPEAVLQRRREP